MIAQLILMAQPSVNFLTGIAISWNDVFGILGWIFLSSGLIEFTPIPLSPLTWIFNYLGGKLNQNVEQEIKEVSKKVDMLEKKVDSLEKSDKDIKDEIERREAINSRRRILIFADEIRKGETRFSRERYDEILYDINAYNNYCSEHPNFENEKAIISEKIVEEKYKEYMSKNLFM